MLNVVSAIVMAIITAVVVVAILSTDRPTAPMAATTESSQDQKRENDLSLAGTFVVFAQNCPREFYALTPQRQDAVDVFVGWAARDHGADAVRQAAAKEDGYYRFGNRWCASVAGPTVRSITSQMTRGN